MPSVFNKAIQVPVLCTAVHTSHTHPLPLFPGERPQNNHQISRWGKPGPPLSKDISLKEFSELTCRPSSRFFFPHLQLLLCKVPTLSFSGLRFWFLILNMLGTCKETELQFQQHTSFFQQLFISEINSINNGEKIDRKEKPTFTGKCNFFPRLET